MTTYYKQYKDGEKVKLVLYDKNNNGERINEKNIYNLTILV